MFLRQFAHIGLFLLRKMTMVINYLIKSSQYAPVPAPEGAGQPA
jgi:hypothetical protein